MEMQELNWTNAGEKPVEEKHERKRAKTEMEHRELSHDASCSYHDNCAPQFLLPPESKNQRLIAGLDSTAPTARGCHRETKEETLFQKILGIPVITDVLWSYLTSEELQPCRFVSWAWKESVTAEMVRRNLCRLQFSCRQGSCSFVRTRWALNARIKVEFPPAASRGTTDTEEGVGVGLQDLIQLLTRSQELVQNKAKKMGTLNMSRLTFPCSNFTFTDGNLNGEEDSTLCDFLARHGEIVKTLRLEKFQLAVHILLPLFEGKLQNLRKLSLVSVKPIFSDKNWKEMELPGDGDHHQSPWILPFLTTVHVEDPQLLPFLIMLMNGAPNLKFIGDLPLHPQSSPISPSPLSLFYTDSPQTRTKLSLIVGLVVSWTNQDSVSVTARLEALRQLPIKRIRILTLDHPTGALPNSQDSHNLLSIIKSNALSLRVVHATFSEFFSPFINDTSLAALANVEHLTVDVGNGVGEQFDAALILKVFPNLSSIYLRFTREVIPGQGLEELEKSKGKQRRKMKMKWSDYFTTSPRLPPQNPGIFKGLSFPSVTKLETLGTFSASWFKPLVHLFPHVQSVTMNLEMQYKFLSYAMANGKWLKLKHLFYSTVAMATPVKERHEVFVLSLS